MVILIFLILYLLFIELYLAIMMLLFILLYTYCPVIFEIHIKTVYINNIISSCIIKEGLSTECTICYDQINKGIKLPCNCKYIYHVDCIKKFLKQRLLCPVCRTNLIELTE